MNESHHSDTRERLFSGEGEMCALMRSHDWSQTPLGEVERWPQSLRTTVSILLNSRYPMFIFWGAQRVKLYNDAYRPILGSTKHPAALGKPGAEVWPEIWDTIGPMVEQVMTEATPTWSDNLQLFMHRSGYREEVYFTFSYSPVRDESGGVGGMFCACTETTQQVLGDRRLRTLRDLAAQAGDAKTAEAACQIAMTTLAHNRADIPFALLYLLNTQGNQAILAGTTGIAPHEIASPRIVTLTNRSDSKTWSFTEVIHTASVIRLTDVVERFGALPGGLWEESPHTALVLPVASPGQERPTGILVAGISPRRALDDDYQGFLELVARQIAAAIADARAYEAERQRAEALAEIDRAKTLFFSNISHEFRTPLTLMLAPLEDVLDDTTDPLPPIQRDRLQMVQRNSLRLLKLVNTLLDFARIEAGRIQAIYEPTDLSTLTAELASTFRSLIERAGLMLVVDCPPLSEAIYIDRELWEKIVLNLLSNAFKFTFSGTITVRLRERHHQALLQVEDTGMGIAEAEIPHLFQRFHRIKGVQGRSFEGSGIGLSLVQELVKLHGGQIQVTSRLGQGSCFTVTIPTGSAHLPSDRLRQALSSPTPTSTLLGATPYIEEAWRWLPQGSIPEESRSSELFMLPTPTAIAQICPEKPSHARILIVDDNADLRNYTQHLLAQCYTVETAEDGVAALDAIRERKPDLVLADVMMPKLDGFGLLRALRDAPTTEDLPIILLSARAGEESRLEGLHAGADDYLIKPFSSRELLARVDVHLKMAQVRRDAARREQALRCTTEEVQQRVEDLSERLSQILEQMIDAFIALDADWRIIYQNRAAEQINGKPRSEVLGKTQWDEWPASVGTEIEHQYRRAIAEQIPVQFEHHYYEPPNRDVWLEIHAYPLKDGLGIFFRDISDRKRTDAALKESQAQLQHQLAEIETIYQSAPIGLNVLDRDLRFVRINQRLAEMNGLSIEAHIGHSIRELLPELADAAEQLLYPILETGEPLLNVEICGETPAQPGVQRAWVESFLPLKDGDRIIGISTVCEEVTERKRIETERQRAEAELRSTKAELEQRVAERTAELEKINADLKIQEAALREAQRVAHIGSWAYDLATQTVTWSEELYRIHRLDPSQAAPTGEHMEQCIHPDDRWIDRDRIKSVLMAGHACETDLRIIRQTGEIAYIEVRGEPVLDAQGQTLKWIGTVLDITDRKRAEVALAQREEQLRLTFELTHIGTWDWDLKTQEVAWNDNHFFLLGLSPNPNHAQSLYQQWTHAIHPDDRDRVQQALFDALAHHTDYEMEYRVIYPDGSIHWLLGKGRGIYNAAHEPIRMLGVILDISDRKQAEQMLDLQAVITRNMAEGICLVRADNGVIVYANPKFEQMFGYAPNELDGQPVSIVNYDGDRLTPEEVNQAIRAAVLNQGEATYEVHNVKKDGTPFWCSATTSVFDHPDYGRVLVAVHQDISDRKLAQERIEASLKEKEVLLKEIHHRVKNNLQIVDGLLKMQARRVKDPHVQTVLRDSQSRIASIALVHEKLYRSDDLANIDFVQYIRDLTTHLFESYDVNPHQIQLDTQVDNVVLDIAIAIPCGLIINELVSNAIKYAFPDHRKGKIHIELHLTDQTLTLMVQDNGIGLPPDFDLSHVRSLGMTLIQGLVEQLEATLTIEQHPGTQFIISFHP